MAIKRPAFQFYTGDWMKDPKLSMCQPSTRGIWVDLMCAMHENDQSGEIAGTVEQLARICRCSPPEMRVALSDLSVTKTANVTHCNGIVTVICRRMFAEAKARKDGRERVKRYRENKDGNENVTIPSSSSSSYVTNVTGETPPDKSSVSKRIWTDGTNLLVADGMPQKDAKSLLGKLAKKYTNELLAECIAVTQAKNPAEVHTFLIATLNARSKGDAKRTEVLPSVDDMEKNREKFKQSINTGKPNVPQTA